jgi:hypothetical protein
MRAFIRPPRSDGTLSIGVNGAEQAAACQVGALLVILVGAEGRRTSHQQLLREGPEVGP